MDCDTTHLTTSHKIFSCFNLLLIPSNTGTQQVKDGFSNLKSSVISRSHSLTSILINDEF